MWIFMPDAFVSIAEHGDDRRLLVVRARISGDIERIFPEAQVMETPDEDYRFRATLSRERVALVVSSRISHIQYQSVSGSVQDEERWSAYISVLSSMQEEQQRRTDRNLDLEPKIGRLSLDGS
jgi:hypothetical protein